MPFPIHFPDQLRQHLRSLRKTRGLTQAQLGERLGVKQARIAEIEADPGAVSVAQMIKILAALDAAIVLNDRNADGGFVAAETRSGRAFPSREAPQTRTTPRARTKGGVEPSSNARTYAQTPPRALSVRQKKGAW